jgi:molybdenum cofactor biosynthesis enzyme MoaA/predicted O-methyltransferase YrrM
VSKGRTNVSLQRTKLQIAKEHFEKKEYLQALAILDEMIERENLTIIRSLRAAIREVINDLAGAFSDIATQESTPDQILVKARLLAKLGNGEKATLALRSFLKSIDKQNYSKWSPLALGIAGRRMDLELLGIKPEKMLIAPKLDSRTKGCVAEHLVALGEFNFCKKLLENDTDAFPLLSILTDIENADRLTRIKNNEISNYVEEVISKISGWFSLDEARLLANLASEIPAEYNIVEVGSFQGRSTCALAVGAKKGFQNPIHAIDTFFGLRGIFPESTLSIFQTNLRKKGLEKNVTIHRGKSVETAESWSGKNIGLLFIDADHDYESVKGDLDAWLPHVSPTGLIALHDCNQLGPNKLLRQIILNSSNMHMIGLRDSLAVLQLQNKNPKQSPKTRATWLQYLTILGQNYSTWVETEKIRINRVATDLFDQTTQRLTNLDNPKILINSSSKYNFDEGQTRKSSIDQPTTVIDITYKCNAICKYCQWGNPCNSVRKHLPIKSVCLSAKTIKALGTKRIVLSGGEPRLHPKLNQILSHYKKLVDSVIIISNGYGLDVQEISQLVDYGATGIAVSLDSVDQNLSRLTRQTPLKIHRQIIANLKEIADSHRNFELGINAVVSHVTANCKNVQDLLEFGQSIGVDYVKFQPIFDDGYVTINPPDLILTVSDSKELLRISSLINSAQYSRTNPPEFWKNVADLASGKQLSAESCGIGDKHSIAIRENLAVCYWLNTISFGNSTRSLDQKKVQCARKNFEKAKIKCKVDFHCFCTQELSHVWRNEGNYQNER